ncbi:hypothetical protein QCA50_012488 [Cerrena zonata]|uniref:Cyclopropane-fatty-acyl-phospholipid synthase n=1 Tax=Cerrena zonata TaxID=2478898 RepID=A0AAW0G4C5_9APHY
MFGQNDGSVKTKCASLRVQSEAFWVRVYLRYDLGFSEAFMAGDFTTPDLKAILNIYVDNLGTLDTNLASVFYIAQALAEKVLMYFNHGLSMAICNIADYDVSNEFYQAFLSKEMKYSCPLWSKEEGGVRGDLEGHRRPGDLEAAQTRMIKYVLAKAQLRPGDRLLEIGSGWGGMAIEAARMGCTVDTITLSIEQLTLAKQLAKEAGFEKQVRVHLMDYRNLPPEFKGAFDACVSLEMLEAVGVEWLPTYFKQIDWALKSDRAAVVMTASVYPEATYTPHQGNDFVRKYHWPGSVCPSATSLPVDIHKSVPKRFTTYSIDDLGMHYPRCLREWGRRLDESWTPELIQSLQERHPALKDELKLGMFKRRWEYMFQYMEVAYSRVWLSLKCWTMTRPGQAEEVSA